MPTAKKMKSGSWRCQVFIGTETVAMPDGTVKNKKIRKSFTVSDPSPQGKKQCEKMAADWMAEREQMGNVYDITFGEAIDRYISDREKVFSPNTVNGYREIRKNDFQDLMNKKISSITQEDIQRSVNIMSGSHSPKTVRNSHALLTAVFAVYRPNFAVRTVLPKKTRSQLYVPTDADIKRLMTAVKGTNMELPILLAAFGPMRRGEIAALDSSDINGNTVHVCKNLVRKGNGEWIIKSPKSYAGDRYIEYPDFVAEKWQGIEGRIVDICPNTITHRFGLILKKLDLPHFRFHDLRHYAASIQHAIGIPDVYIMQRGGWSNDGTLKSVYRHAMEDREEEMNKKANEYFTSLADDAAKESNGKNQ